MDKKKLQVVVVSFALGGLAMFAYLAIYGVFKEKQEQRKFMDSVYGDGYYDSIN